jgi:hypothetical protein
VVGREVELRHGELRAPEASACNRSFVLAAERPVYLQFTQLIIVLILSLCCSSLVPRLVPHGRGLSLTIDCTKLSPLFGSRFSANDALDQAMLPPSNAASCPCKLQQCWRQYAGK